MRIGSNSQPRVLFAATSGGEGGIERYSVALAALLQKRGFEVFYACRPDGFLAAHCAVQGIPAFPWQVRNSGDLRASAYLRHVLQEYRINILHVHSRRDYVPALLAAAPLRRRGLRAVLHAHMLRPLGDPPRLAAYFFRIFADRVICVSQAVRNELIQAHRFAPAFVPVIPNGVDTDVFAPPESPEGQAWRLRQRAVWGIPADATVIGMVGRLDAKGQQALLEAAPHAFGARGDVWVVLLGPEGRHGETERLRAQAEALGMGERLILPGSTEDVATAMTAFDLLVHLPADESFGLVLAEAMAAGRPVIASDIGGCREVVCDGVTGLLVPLGDREALVKALGCFLDGPAAAVRLRRFGAAGRQRVLDEFSLTVQVSRLCDLYARL